jgi:hypothetical protein
MVVSWVRSGECGLYSPFLAGSGACFRGRLDFLDSLSTHFGE